MSSCGTSGTSEVTEIKQDEMMQWALRTLQRTQYLSDLESEDEEKKEKSVCAHSVNMEPVSSTQGNAAVPSVNPSAATIKDEPPFSPSAALQNPGDPMADRALEPMDWCGGDTGVPKTEGCTTPLLDADVDAFLQAVCEESMEDPLEGFASVLTESVTLPTMDECIMTPSGVIRNNQFPISVSYDFTTTTESSGDGCILDNRITLSSGQFSSVTSEEVSNYPLSGDSEDHLQKKDEALRTQEVTHPGVVSEDDWDKFVASVPPPRSPTTWTVRASTPEEKALFRVQERQRFENNQRAFTYWLHGYESVVGPVKLSRFLWRRPSGRLLSVVDERHLIFLALVRDAVARLPNGKGTLCDIINLLSDSQYVGMCWPQGVNVLLKVVEALALLVWEENPCLRYNAERDMCIYLHRGQSEEELELLYKQRLNTFPDEEAVMLQNVRNLLNIRETDNSALTSSRPVHLSTSSSEGDEVPTHPLCAKRTRLSPCSESVQQVSGNPEALTMKYDLPDFVALAGKAENGSVGVSTAFGRWLPSRILPSSPALPHGMWSSSALPHGMLSSSASPNEMPSSSALPNDMLSSHLPNGVSSASTLPDEIMTPSSGLASSSSMAMKGVDEQQQQPGAKIIAREEFVKTVPDILCTPKNLSSRLVKAGGVPSDARIPDLAVAMEDSITRETAASGDSTIHNVPKDNAKTGSMVTCAATGDSVTLSSSKPLGSEGVCVKCYEHLVQFGEYFKGTSTPQGGVRISVAFEGKTGGPHASFESRNEVGGEDACSMCDTVCLEQVIVKHVEILWVHQCQYCKTRYIDYRQLSSHEKICLQHIASSCLLCIGNHWVLNSLASPLLFHMCLTCPVCGQQFVSLFNLGVYWIKRGLKCVNIHVRGFLCILCGLKVNGKKSLNAHMKNCRGLNLQSIAGRTTPQDVRMELNSKESRSPVTGFTAVHMTSPGVTNMAAEKTCKCAHADGMGGSTICLICGLFRSALPIVSESLNNGQVAAGASAGSMWGANTAVAATGVSPGSVWEANASVAGASPNSVCGTAAALGHQNPVSFYSGGREELLTPTSSTLPLSPYLAPSAIASPASAIVSPASAIASSAIASPASAIASPASAIASPADAFSFHEEDSCPSQTYFASRRRNSIPYDGTMSFRGSAAGDITNTGSAAWAAGAGGTHYTSPNCCVSAQYSGRVEALVDDHFSRTFGFSNSPPSTAQPRGGELSSRTRSFSKDSRTKMNQVGVISPPASEKDQLAKEGTARSNTMEENRTEFALRNDSFKHDATKLDATSEVKTSDRTVSDMMAIPKAFSVLRASSLLSASLSLGDMAVCMKCCRELQVFSMTYKKENCGSSFNKNRVEAEYGKNCLVCDTAYVGVGPAIVDYISITWTHLCRHCGWRCMKIKSLNAHVRTCVQRCMDPERPCTLCAGTRFDSPLFNLRVWCYTCSRPFRAVFNLHVDSSGHCVSSYVQAIWCADCDLPMKSKKALNKHMEEHGGRGNHKSYRKWLLSD